MCVCEREREREKHRARQLGYRTRRGNRFCRGSSPSFRGPTIALNFHRCAKREEYFYRGHEPDATTLAEQIVAGISRLRFPLVRSFQDSQRYSTRPGGARGEDSTFLAGARLISEGNPDEHRRFISRARLETGFAVG